MKRFIVVLALAAAVGVMAVGSGTASNGRATPFKTHYTWVSYNNDALWTCSGARVVNKKTTKESETCLITGDTTGYVAGTYSGNPTGNLPPLTTDFSWYSDYYFSLGGSFDPPATSWTAKVTDNGDGTFTIDAVSYY